MGERVTNYREWPNSRWRSALRPFLGPWNEEPDHAQWYYQGLLCSLSRTATGGAWRGEVQIPFTHPAAHWGEEKLNEQLLVVPHGGVHLGRCTEAHCYWVVRFDVSGDLIPLAQRRGAEYRPLAFARAQLDELASQLVAMVSPSAGEAA